MFLLKTLLQISYAFSTAPHYNFEIKQTRKFKFYKVYSSCTLLLIVVAFLYSSIKFRNDEDTPNNSSQSQQIHNLLEMLSSLLLAVAALIAVSTAVFVSNKWQSLLKQIQDVDVKLGVMENNSTSNQRKVYIKLFLIYLPKLCKDIFCTFVYNNSERIPKYFICNTIFEYYCFTPTLLIVCLGLSLKNKYKMLLKLLKLPARNVAYTENNFFITELLPKNNLIYGDYLRGMSKMFRLLYSIIDNCNLIFGYQLLFMLGHTLLSVLQTFDYCLKYKQTTQDSTNILFANLCNTGFNLVIIKFSVFIHFLSVIVCYFRLNAALSLFPAI